jgi:hypothetical protein
VTDPKRERRSRPRLPVRLPVSIKSKHGGIEATGFTRDLNLSGIFLYTESPMCEGSELEMVLILPPEITQGEKQWICCRASVVRVEANKPGGSFGVAAHIRSLEILPEIPT